MKPPSSRLRIPGFVALIASGLPIAAAAPPENWRLVFSDEFEGGQLDTTKWNTTMAFAGTHGPRYHNEYYLSYTLDDEVTLDGGVLRLGTDRRTVSGKEPMGLFEYSQGLVSTHDKFAFQHGFVEIRAKFPGGKGLWPCFWLMPGHQSWPPEFDIAEYYGGQQKMHYGLAYGSMIDPQWDSTGDSETDFVNEWRTIALEWLPGRATWYVDGEVRKTVVADYVPDLPMYVILSNSVSSRYGPSGEPDADTVFPNYFEIDYVRVYQPQPSPVASVPGKPTPAEPSPIIAALPSAALP